MTWNLTRPTISFFSGVNHPFHLECSDLRISMREGDGGRCSTSQIFFGKDEYESTCLCFKKGRSGTRRGVVWLLETLWWLWILSLLGVLGHLAGFWRIFPTNMDMFVLWDYRQNPVSLSDQWQNFVWCVENRDIDLYLGCNNIIWLLWSFCELLCLFVIND